MSKAKKVKNNDTYLVVADDTDGFQLALRYATDRAVRDGANLAILHVMDKEDFQHWGGIEERIHEEQRQEAEGILLSAADKSQELGGAMPTLYLEEGGRYDVIIKVIREDETIRRLILGAEASSNNPGPLVSYFTGKGLPDLGVPLTLIPGNLTDDAIEGLF